MSEENERYLVLCVDRDDDLGRKTGISTPVVGRQQVVSAATRLAVADPEEADTNAMFASVKKFDELGAKGVAAEVAVVCGDENGGFDADRKVRREVEAVIGDGRFSGIIFVSDGGDDEQVMPLLQNIRPIVSVVRVAIKHSESVEQTYMVLGRYLRMLVFDPRYSKWVLGVPGVILLLAGILIAANQTLAAELLALLIIGGAFAVRGFNLDRWLAGILSRGPYGYVRLFSTIASGLVILVGISSGYALASASAQAASVVAHPSLLLVDAGILAGYFISGALFLVSIGLIIYTTGSMLAHLVRGSQRAWRDGVAILMVVLLYYPVGTFASILIGAQRESDILLVSYILLGLAVIFGLTTVIVPRVRTRATVAAE
ncbi:MAG TPA: DUF373 family protein [Nitrososphaerales archaeon]|nr:DUF373 family protein [Nitrososphaerales archaeon]